MKTLKSGLLLTCLVVVFSLSQSMSQVRINEEGIYYGSDGSLFTGLYEVFDEKGNISKSVNVVSGKPHGLARVFFPGGGVKEVQYFKSGLMDGVWATYNQEGVKTAEASYSEGEKHGNWYIWTRSGSLLYEMYYENGQRQGTWKRYDEEGNIVESISY